MALRGQWDYRPPAWVALVQVARWARVPPWELERAPSHWRDRIAVVMEAEAHAREQWREQSSEG